MGVRSLDCIICEKKFFDNEEFCYCSKCGMVVCGDCYGDQLEKNGRVDESSQEADDFGEDALVKCDSCKG